jgi:hypothetical protein
MSTKRLLLTFIVAWRIIQIKTKNIYNYRYCLRLGGPPFFLSAIIQWLLSHFVVVRSTVEFSCLPYPQCRLLGSTFPCIPRIHFSDTAFASVHVIFFSIVVNCSAGILQSIPNLHSNHSSWSDLGVRLKVTTTLCCAARFTSLGSPSQVCQSCLPLYLSAVSEDCHLLCHQTYDAAYCWLSWICV